MGGRLKMLKFIVCEDDAEELNIAVQTITKSMMKYADIEYKVEKFQRYNEKLEKIINAGYSEVYIIGHSMGGVIASYLASKYKQVKKLVLAAPAFHYLAFKGDKVDILESIKKLPNLFKNYNPEEVLSRLFKVPAPTIREFMKLVEEHTGDVKNITCPTLILHGDKDDIVPLSLIHISEPTRP